MLRPEFDSGSTSHRSHTQLCLWNPYGDSGENLAAIMNAEGTVGRRSFLKGAALVAGGAAVGAGHL